MQAKINEPLHGFQETLGKPPRESMLQLLLPIAFGALTLLCLIHIISLCLGSRALVQSTTAISAFAI